MRAFLLFLALVLAASLAVAGLEGMFPGGPDHPAIGYATRPLTDAVAQLNAAMQAGSVRLKFEGEQGYLRAVLDALKIPVESQLVVFSKTSSQTARIGPSNPRALYFNDSIVAGWVRGGPIVEIASLDPRQGVIFYTLDQQPAEHPRFDRRDSCLACHLSYSTLGVPGVMVRSVYPAASGLPMRQAGEFLTDDRSPIGQRWGGWYVTGKTIPMNHMGNAMVSNPLKPEAMITASTVHLESLQAKFETGAYLSPYSDIVALMVFEHQMRMFNLITRVGWEVRLALYEAHAAHTDSAALDARIRDIAKELVDALLFTDEAPIAGTIQGSSGFAEKFAAQGPADSHGRSLRQFDLERRLMRYPCSYMIYSKAFDALPDEARDAVYQGMGRILSGEEKDPKYARLSPADRGAITGIVRETGRETKAIN